MLEIFRKFFRFTTNAILVIAFSPVFLVSLSIFVIQYLYCDKPLSFKEFFEPMPEGKAS